MSRLRPGPVGPSADQPPARLARDPSRSDRQLLMPSARSTTPCPRSVSRPAHRPRAPRTAALLCVTPAATDAVPPCSGPRRVGRPHCATRHSSRPGFSPPDAPMRTAPHPRRGRFNPHRRVPAPPRFRPRRLLSTGAATQPRSILDESPLRRRTRKRSVFSDAAGAPLGRYHARAQLKSRRERTSHLPQPYLNRPSSDPAWQRKRRRCCVPSGRRGEERRSS